MRASASACAFIGLVSSCLCTVEYVHEEIEGVRERAGRDGRIRSKSKCGNERLEIPYTRYR